MIQKFCCLALIGILFGCSKITVENPTDRFLAAEKVSKLENSLLEEVSGGAVSVNNSGMIWLHNDSGNPANLFLVDRKLNIRFTCTLKDITNRDWEDMAIGPGPVSGKNYIYIGDIGDNDSKYDTKYIYRFEEPVWDGKTDQLTIEKFDTISFEIKAKKRDLETLMLDPATKDIYLISKRDDPVWLYRLKHPYSTDSTIMAEKLFALPFVQIVGGDFSRDGKKVLVKNYEHVYYWENNDGLPVEELLKQEPYEVPYVLEPQGETIMWAPDESGFYTISEKNVGKDSYLYFYSTSPKGKKS
jgi:hypothetical protein